MARFNTDTNSGLNAYIAHLPGVGKAVRDAASEIKDKAQANLAQHRDTGHAKITMTKGDLDWYVNLVDDQGSGKRGVWRAPLAIEFGWTTPTGRHVPGLYVLTRAAHSGGVVR